MEVNKKRILVVDDHFVVREGLKMIFETEERFEVVGEAENGQQALEMMERVKPDLVLMDLNMPGMNGIETMRELNNKGSSVPIVILTTLNETKLIKEGLSLGAKGYLLKDCTRDQLFRTADAAIRSEVLLQPEINKRLFTPEEEPTPERKTSQSSITERELFVLSAIARGCTSKEIALEMGISERTVKAHLTNIYGKLMVESRAEAVAVAIEQGIIHVESNDL